MGQYMDSFLPIQSNMKSLLPKRLLKESFVKSSARLEIVHSESIIC
jgi:hypothetical protein